MSHLHDLARNGRSIGGPDDVGKAMCRTDRDIGGDQCGL